MIVLTGLLTLNPGLSQESPRGKKDYPIQPVPFTAVKVADHFWKPRIETNRKVSIPYAFKKCEETGRIDNFAVAGGLKQGTFTGKYPFNDSDVYKIMEGAAYSLSVQPDKELDNYLDDLVAKIAAAQEDDGYLYTARTIFPDPPVIWVEKKERWSHLRLGHELYNMGHFYEAAVAHYQATGKRTMLDMALKNADLIAQVFGSGKKQGVPGHQVIEMGLAKLYRVTGEEKYLQLAKFFLDERGRAHGRELYGEYSQDHLPVVEQNEAVGHAVRAAYMYAGMADIAALTGDQSYVTAINRIWENVVNKKMYLTGGIGATNIGEAFGANYQLPNAAAYAETCAAVANAMWNHRMFLLHGDAKYIDVLERVLYNGVIPGISFSGDRFFYANPLESSGQHVRKPWFGCACCPSNVTRFMPSLPGYIYAVTDNHVYVNLFIQGDTQLMIKGKKVKMTQTTGYPWEGEVLISIEPEQPVSFTLNVRVPGWAQNRPVPGHLYRYLKNRAETVMLHVNNKSQPLELEKGYAGITRTWRKGDKIQIKFPMPVRRVLAHENAAADRGRVAVERGPIVYCAEWKDNQGHVSNLLLEDGAAFKTGKQTGELREIVVLKAEAKALYQGESSDNLRVKKQPLVLIPYYAWAHRGKGEMAVWLARESWAAKPLPRPAGDYPIQPVPFTSVQLEDSFWAPRIETNRTVTIPFAINKNEETDRVDNFRKAAGLKKGPYIGKRYNDTDVYKVMEGIAYTLQQHPDPKMEKVLEDLVKVVAAAQEEDGYLFTTRTIDPENPAPGAGHKRWSHLRGSHELYNAGHLFEAAVAHYRATGRRSFLEVALKFADLLTHTFGPGKKKDVPGHQEVEIGLAKLYRVTGKQEYLDLARFFLDQRGHKHDGEMYPADTVFALYNDNAHMQDHVPVLRQTEAVGHAVRAAYMYAGMADAAALGAHEDYIRAIDRLWENVVYKKLYITGGIGARDYGEAFGDNYQLPNAEAYAETCAAVGNAMWNLRLFLLHGDSKYIDVLERILYNGMLSGVSLTGDRFFYQNPLESKGGYTRSPWFEVACCPGNITRFIPSVPGYVYAVKDHRLYVNMYVGSSANIHLKGLTVRVIQKTNYPWDGKVNIRVQPEKTREFTLCLRIPGWSRNRPVPGDLYSYLRLIDAAPRAAVNGEAAPLRLEKGYWLLQRRWQSGDEVRIDFPMPVRRVVSHPAVKENKGKVVLERGPLVYCLEGVDNGGKVLDKLIRDAAVIKEEYRSDLLKGVTVLKIFNRPASVPLVAVPYYAWSHRGAGKMAVWISREDK